MTAVGSAFCIRCGSQIVAGASFCSVCGGSQRATSLSEMAVPGVQAPVGAHSRVRVESGPGAQPLAGVLAIIGALGMVPAMLLPLVHYQYPGPSGIPPYTLDAMKERASAPMLTRYPAWVRARQAIRWRPRSWCTSE